MATDRAAELRARFGNLVRVRRNRLGISQEVLARKAGLHRTYIADIERGARNPSLESISKLARALEISISALFSIPDSTAEKKTEPPSAHTGGADILLVEHDADEARMALHAFQQANLGNCVHVARDGAEALDYVFCEGAFTGRKTGHRSDVIFLSLHLPKVDGMEVLRRIKSHEQTRSIPVVILASPQQEYDIMECRRLGAYAHMVKPVDFHGLSQITPKLPFSWMPFKQDLRPKAS